MGLAGCQEARTHWWASTSSHPFGGAPAIVTLGLDEKSLRNQYGPPSRVNQARVTFAPTKNLGINRVLVRTPTRQGSQMSQRRTLVINTVLFRAFTKHSLHWAQTKDLSHQYGPQSSVYQAVFYPALTKGLTYQCPTRFSILFIRLFSDPASRLTKGSNHLLELTSIGTHSTSP